MGRSSIRLLGALLSCFFLLVCPAYGQQLGRIIGEIHVTRGDFPGRILVELYLHGSPIDSAYCDEQGKFGFNSLQSNTYHLVIHDDRFYPVEERANLDLSITAIQMVQINITPRDPEKPKDSLRNQPGGNPFMVDTEQYRSHFPKKAVKEFDRGLQSDQKGDHDQAIEHYEKALALAPDFYPARNNLGSAYLVKSDFKAAQTQFEEAIKLNQSDAQAHLNLANLFLTTKNYDEALKSAQEGIRRAPNSALGQFLLGSIYQRTGKFADAEHALRQALIFDPKMSRVRLELVNLYLVQHKSQEASAELEAFLKDSPDDPLAARARELLGKLQTPR